MFVIAPLFRQSVKTPTKRGLVSLRGYDHAQEVFVIGDITLRTYEYDDQDRPIKFNSAATRIEWDYDEQGRLASSKSTGTIQVFHLFYSYDCEAQAGSTAQVAGSHGSHPQENFGVKELGVGIAPAFTQY